MNVNAAAAPIISPMPPPIKAGTSPATISLPSPVPLANMANTAPSTATPSVAPTMRAVLTRPEAVPERAAGTLATATAFTGPVLRPRPQPITSKPASTRTRLSLSGMSASMNRPVPIIAMPNVIGRRGPNALAILPESCETTTKATDIGNNSMPANSALSPRTLCR